MKNTQSYFYKKYGLNKGYMVPQEDKQKSSESPESYSFLTADLVSVFEESNPGTVKKIMDLAERDQRHRHAQENTDLVAQHRFKIYGKIISSISLLIVSYVTLMLFVRGYSIAAIIFSSSYFISIFGISFISYLQKNIEKKHHSQSKFKSFKPSKNKTYNIQQKNIPVKYKKKFK